VRNLPVRFLFAAILGTTSLLAAAQSPIINAVKVTKPPTIDGIIGLEEWAGIPSMHGGYDENTGAKAPEDTEYFFAYDEKFVYFAAKAFDSQPQSIKAQEYRTNVAIKGDDFVGIFIDVFGDLSAQANQFEINPRGATNLRIAGGRAAKREWLGEIQAKGRITKEGYEVEARIPWVLMRLPAAGKRNMRIGGYRVMPRTGRAYLITDITNNNVQNIPVWQGVDVPVFVAPREIKLLPYTYVGYDKDKGGLFNSGMDLKYTTSSGIDLIGSINPDFRNIENQVLSLDFSYFERLASESRPFFLEGQQFFRTSQDAPLFSSQRIPNFDAGFKAFGKITDKTQFSFLDTFDVNKLNDFVGVLRHGFSDRTSFTAAVADRNAKDSPLPGPKTFTNLGSFYSLNTGVGPTDYFAQYEPTRDSINGNGHRINTGANYQGKGLFGLLEYTEVSPQFLPRLGFAPERGFQGYSGNVGVNKQFSKGLLQDAFYFLSGEMLTQWHSNAEYRKRANLYSEFGLRNNTGVNLSGFYQEFRGFKDHLTSVDLVLPRNDPYRNWRVQYGVGKFAGQQYTTLGASAALRPYKNFQLSLSHQTVHHFDTQNQTIVSGSYEISPYDSIVGRAVRQNTDTNFYAAYRRTGNTGNEYFLIIGDPNARSFRASIILKAVFPMNFKF
jgi:hypothetical protein